MLRRASGLVLYLVNSNVISSFSTSCSKTLRGSFIIFLDLSRLARLSATLVVIYIFNSNASSLRPYQCWTFSFEKIHCSPQSRYESGQRCIFNHSNWNGNFGGISDTTFIIQGQLQAHFRCCEVKSIGPGFHSSRQYWPNILRLSFFFC